MRGIVRSPLGDAVQAAARAIQADPVQTRCRPEHETRALQAQLPLAHTGSMPTASVGMRTRQKG
jgi:hypothetical protein